VRTRYELLVAAGECERARDEATAWRALEPQSARPLAALARGLYASGAPRPSVEEALSTRWNLLPPADKKATEAWDRALLAVIDGDFTRADELAHDYDSALAPSADSYDHAIPARLRMNLLMEMEKMKDAAKAANSFLGRMAAWAAYPFALDPSIGFYEPLFRAGEMTKAELVAKRKEWTERELRRSTEGRTATDPWILWATVYGSFAESHDEAVEALATVPSGVPTPSPGQRAVFVDFALGKVFVLMSRWDDAMPYLQRVVTSCTAFDDVLVVQKARLLLAQALEAKGEIASAKAQYQRIVDTWPKTAPSTSERSERGVLSKTWKRAEARLTSLR
jgi:hypothetical protein